MLCVTAGVMCEEDIDECVSAPCFPGVSCENTRGSFACGPCPDHFTGDGKNCIRELYMLTAFEQFVLKGMVSHILI